MRDLNAEKLPVMLETYISSGGVAAYVKLPWAVDNKNSKNFSKLIEDEAIMPPPGIDTHITLSMYIIYISSHISTMLGQNSTNIAHAQVMETNYETRLRTQNPGR